MCLCDHLFHSTHLGIKEATTQDRDMMVCWNDVDLQVGCLRTGHGETRLVRASGPRPVDGSEGPCLEGDVTGGGGALRSELGSRSLGELGRSGSELQGRSRGERDLRKLLGGRCASLLFKGANGWSLSRGTLRGLFTIYGLFLGQWGGC